MVLLHRWFEEAAPPGSEAALTAALAAHAGSRHAAVERALDWVIAMCGRRAGGTACARDKQTRKGERALTRAVLCVLCCCARSYKQAAPFILIYIVGAAAAAAGGSGRDDRCARACK